METETTPVLLLVEDDYVDVEIARRNIRLRGLNCAIHVSSDGRQAVDTLRNLEIAGETQRVIVLLDINMPGMNGHQFLDEIRSDPKLKSTIVFVLTTSDHPSDVGRAYDRNIAGYFVKSDLDGLLNVIEPYLASVQFPPQPQ